MTAVRKETTTFELYSKSAKHYKAKLGQSSLMTHTWYPTFTCMLFHPLSLKHTYTLVLIYISLLWSASGVTVTRWTMAGRGFQHPCGSTSYARWPVSSACGGEPSKLGQNQRMVMQAKRDLASCRKLYALLESDEENGTIDFPYVFQNTNKNVIFWYLSLQ